MPIKTPQVVSPLPLPPNPADRSTFNTRAYPWSEALAPWTDQVNQLGADTLENAQSAQSDASSASSNAGLAAGYASSASTDAGLALGYKDAAYGSQQAAAGSASAASTASGQAQTARDLARQWASDTTVVADGLKGARGYAQDAAQSAADASSVVLGEVFDDTQSSATKGWTSSKIVAWVASWWSGVSSVTPAADKAVVSKSDGKIDIEFLDTVGNGKVLRVGAGGWLGQGEVLATPYGYPVSIDDVTNQTKVISSESVDNSVAEYSTGIHFAAADSWGRLRVSNDTTNAWIQGGDATAGTGWTVELLHTANTLQETGTSTSFPMSQAATTAAINDVIQSIDDGSGPRPTKNHGNVAVTGSQTVTCNVQESDFHIMSMATSDAVGTLTIDFSNMPDTLGKHFSWHVRLQRGARKTVAFAQTVNWAGGVTPTFGSNPTSQDLMLFYKVDSETIRGMVIDAW